MAKTKKKPGKAVAALIAGSASLLLIGIFHLLAEASDVIHDFLLFLPKMGTLSGKLVIGYAAGIILYFVLAATLEKKKLDLLKWTWILIIALILASLFVFTPFVELIVG